MSTVIKNGKRKLNIMFADFCYYNRHTMYSRYAPLSIGMIAQYSKQKFGEDINVSLFKNIEKFFEKAKENPPDVVGLSIYFWNKAINQYAVNRLRQMFGKKVIIVVGGPSIDSDIKEQYNFLTNDFPNADAVITNEGEQVFAEIGQGNLNWEKIIDATKNSKIEWIVVEQDFCQSDPFDCLKTSYHFLNKYGFY